MLNKENMDISCREGADTLIATAEHLDNHSEGDDTLNTAGKKKGEVKKKTIKTEWLEPVRKPTENEIRKMFGKALEMLLKLCMDNHIYQFQNKCRIQNKGGPTGLKITGEIADCLMVDWDSKFLEKLKSFKLVPEVYTRFKDDIEILIESLEAGSKFENGNIVLDEEKKLTDENRTSSKITMDVIQGIANSISPMIQLTVETPCNFKDGYMPVLDIKVKINEKETNRVDFEFYEKPTKNSKVILADSALSFSKKRTILTQEVLRRLRNTKVELGPDIQKKHLNLLMLKMKNSGYRQKFRKEVLDSGQKAFQKMLKDDKCGLKPMYRSADYNAKERQNFKSKKRQNWWNTEKSKIQYKNVCFVTPTPGGVLMKDLQKREAELNKEDKDRIKFVERGGMKMKNILCAKNPFTKPKCELKSCPMCSGTDFIEVSTDAAKISCNTNNVGYRWCCVTCQERNITKVY